jgi:hypothetical protein
MQKKKHNIRKVKVYDEPFSKKKVVVLAVHVIMFTVGLMLGKFIKSK